MASNFLTNEGERVSSHAGLLDWTIQQQADFPEEGAARSPSIGALQNIRSFVRFARKELRDFGIARRKIDARLQFNELAKVLRWHPPKPYFRRLALRFCFFTNCSARFGPNRPSGRNRLPRSWL